MGEGLGEDIVRKAALAQAERIAAAGDDARLIVARDPELKSERGKALLVLQELFDWKAGLALRDAG